MLPYQLCSSSSEANLHSTHAQWPEVSDESAATQSWHSTHADHTNAPAGRPLLLDVEMGLESSMLSFCAQGKTAACTNLQNVDNLDVYDVARC